MKSLLFTILLLPYFSLAAIKTKPLSYSAGDVKMEGLVAFDDSISAARPGLLVVHDWMGRSSFTDEKAVELAKKGYIAFSVDIYGINVRPKNSEEAARIAGKYKGDRSLLRRHIRAAYDQLLQIPGVDKEKIAVFGYCFGGTTALELARSGAKLAGTVSFHGGLENPNPKDTANIHGPVLILHGADDPFVSAKEVADFKKEMKLAKKKFELISYPGAVHAFAVPQAGSDKSKGAAYDADADKKSWQAFNGFLKEIF